MRQELTKLTVNLPTMDKKQHYKINPKIKALLFTDKPAHYLLHIGLDLESYEQTRLISEPIKIFLLEKILNSTTAEESLKIIYHLLKLEFKVDTANPIRSGNRLIGLLMRSFVAKEETKDKAREFHYLQAIQNTTFQETYIKCSQNKKLSNYVDIIPENVKRMWLIMQKAAEMMLKDAYANFATKGLVSTPPFQYSQILPSNSLEEAMANSLDTPVATTKEQGEQLLKEITKGATLPDWVNEETEQRQEELEMKITTSLNKLKIHIKENHWQVANVGLFKGGVINEGQRVPHRVNDILKIIQQFEHRNLNAVGAYDQIVSYASAALTTPRRGRYKTTTDFYRNVVNHNWLVDLDQGTDRQLTL